MRRLVPLSLVALLLLSGCSGTLPGGDTTQTTTPEELDPAAADLPPGVNESGVQNASRLVAAHSETLLAEGFVLNSTATTNGSSYGNRTATEHRVADPGGEQFSLVGTTVVHRTPADGSTTSADEYTQRVWHDETTVVSVELPNRTRYHNVEGLFTDRALSMARNYEEVLAAGAFDVEKVIDRGNHTYTTLVATDTRDGVRKFDATFEARFVVDERGVVHEAVVDYAHTEDGTERHIERRLVRLGPSLDRPDWVADVPGAAFRNASLDVDVEHRHHSAQETYLVVTSGGPDALPAGTELNVTTNRNDSAGSGVGPNALQAVVRTDSSLTPGESVYVYRTGETLELTRDRSVAASGDGLRSSVNVAVSHEDVTFGSYGMGWGSASASAESGTASGSDSSSGSSSSGGSSGSDTAGGSNESGSVSGGSSDASTTTEGAA